jgi:hypothetical protein
MSSLGKSGLKVSKVILGAMSFGNPSAAMGWTIPEAQALPVLKRAFDLGINTWDTVLRPADSKIPAHNADIGIDRRTSIPTATQSALLGKHLRNIISLANGSSFYRRSTPDCPRILKVWTKQRY